MRYLEAGDCDGYYASACQNGDLYACKARRIANEEGNAGPLTTFRLQWFSSRYLGRNLTDEELNEIRLKLAYGYARLYSSSSEVARWPKESEIAQLHYDMFDEYGLPPASFGGTPGVPFDDYFEVTGLVFDEFSQFWFPWCLICEDDL